MSDDRHDERGDDVEPRDTATTRRHRGVAASMLAAGMFALDEVLGRKPKKDTVEVREASGEPGDIDADGITVKVDDSTTVRSPAPHERQGRRVVQKRRRQGS